MRQYRFLMLAAVTGVWIAASVSSPASGQSSRVTIEHARASLADGRFADAITQASVLLEQDPASRGAADVAIRAYVASRKNDLALSVYDAWSRAAKRHDALLLAPVAESELQALSAPSQPDLRLRAEALERLARGPSGASARAELERLVTASGGGLAADTCLARLGDPKATLRLAERASAPSAGNKVPVIEALREADARKQAYVLVPLLTDPNPLVRAASAEALGALGYREALPQLRAALDDPVARVRMGAAIGIKRLGDGSADALIRTLLASQSPDVRLMGIEALAGEPSRDWMKLVTPLLTDPNGLTRLRAAELLAGADPGAARAVLAKAALDQNPTVREEAIRILERRSLHDAGVLRPLLADPSSWVRLRAAGAVLAAAGAAAGK